MATDDWKPHVNLLRGRYEVTRRRNSDEVYRHFVSPEAEGALDGLVSRESAQTVINGLNSRGYPDGADWMRAQLPTKQVEGYKNMTLLLYLSDRCNRD